MADVQLEHGYVRIANRLFEAMLHAPFSATHLKIVGAIVRLTYGWRQKSVRISKVALAQAVGCAPSGGFRRVFDELIEEGVVVEVEHARGRGAGVFLVNKNHEQWGKFKVNDAALKAHWNMRLPRQLLGGHASYIYYARAGDEVKIGLSRDPWTRIKNLGVARPGIVLVGIEPGAKLLEKERHRRFAALRLGADSEWFQWGPAIEAHIKEGGFDSDLAPPANRPKEGAFQAPGNRPNKGALKKEKAPRMALQSAPSEAKNTPLPGAIASDNHTRNNELQNPTDIEIHEKQTTATSCNHQNGATPTPREPPAHEAITAYARGLTTALNNAVEAKFGEQPLVVQVVRALNVAERLMGEGVELEFARRFIAQRVPKLTEKPGSVKYFEQAILEAKRDKDQRQLNASDPGVPRGGGVTALASVPAVANVTGAAQARERDERDRAAYDVARQTAAHAWGKDPANQAEYHAIVAAENAKYEGFLDKPYGPRMRDAAIVIACAQRCGFPTLEEWLKRRDRDPPRDPPKENGAKPS